jgi:hypothetical protein
MATLYLKMGIWIKSYNGIAVEKWSIVKIPAGDAEFVAEVWWYRKENNSTIKGRDLSFSYRFEGGKEYTLLPGFGGNRGRDPVISIHSDPSPSEDNLLDEIVFEQQRRVMTAGSK